MKPRAFLYQTVVLAIIAAPLLLGLPQDSARAEAGRAGGSPGEHAADRAKVMTKVEVHRGAETAVIAIFGDGLLRYDAKLIDQGRLVVDLPGLSSALKRKVLPVDHALLKRIRIGSHVDRLRLVFDLPGPIAYSVDQAGNRLSVRLQSAAPPSPASKGLSAQPKQAAPPKRKMARKAPKTTPLKAAPSKVALRQAPTPRVSTITQPSPRLAQMSAGQAASFNPSAGKGNYKGRRISLDFQGADISNVLRLIAEVSGFNIVIGEGVKAKVTMKLVNIPWDQALDMLLKMNNLGMVKEGNIIWIDTLANIAKQQEAEARAQETKIKAENLVTKVIYVQNVKANDILVTLKQHLSPRGQIQVNRGSNALVLQETESNIAEFIKLVRKLDIVSPQVQIEARIVQADTNYSRSLGVQWGLRHSDFNTDGSFQVIGNLTGPFSEPNVEGSDGGFERTFLVNLPAAVTGLNSVPGIGFNMGRLGGGLDLDLRLSAGELLGLTKVIAAPRITTLDNQEAKIEQGEAIPFQTTSLQGTQTTFVDANLTLQVTPQITSRDPNEEAKNILLKVKATRNAVGARSNPAGPSIDKREATTQVMVKNGETVVIGGIFVDTQDNNVQGVPYLSRIPVLGWLFKNKTETVSKQELLIFITPTIVT